MIGEGRESSFRVLAVLRVADLGKRPAGRGLRALGQAIEHVRDLVRPVPLLPGGREYLAARSRAQSRVVLTHDHGDRDGRPGKLVGEVGVGPRRQVPAERLPGGMRRITRPSA